MKKVYKEPQTALATYAKTILEVQPGTSNGGEYSGGSVDVRKRGRFEPEEEEEEAFEQAIDHITANNLW